MRSTKKPIQTGLEIDVKPVSDQEILDRLAEAQVANLKPRGPVQRPQQRRSVPRYVQPMRGLLAPDPQPRSSPFMGLLAIPDTGGSRLIRNALFASAMYPDQGHQRYILYT